MFISKSSFDAIAHNVGFLDLLEHSLNAGMACILTYDTDKKELGDMVAAMELVNDATGYARQLQMRKGQSYWTVSYNSDEDTIQIHY